MDSFNFFERIYKVISMNMCMRTTATIISTIFICVSLRAQNISVVQFRSAPNDFSAAAQETRRLDPDGNACALIKIDTHQAGFSFDAGASCISDIIYAEPGIWLYLPSGTRKLTIAHKQFGSLCGWQFPINIEPAHTYAMTLKTEIPKLEKVRPARPDRPAKPAFDVTGFSSHFLQSHVGMEIGKGEECSATIGISYSFVPGKAGFYFSVDYCDDSGLSFFAGPAFRLLDAQSATDWQIYAGVGYTANNSCSVDIGSHFAWKSKKALSLWDFSVGCQYWGNGSVVPYVGLGAGITGYAAVGILGLILAACATVL